MHYCSRLGLCCFHSQANIYFDDLQLSKIVQVILAKFCPNKLSISANKGCLIIFPRSDLFRPRDFYGFDRFEISHFLPFLRQNAAEVVNFFVLGPAKMGYFLLSSPFFRL